MLYRYDPLSIRTIEDTRPKWYGTPRERAIMGVTLVWRVVLVAKVMVDTAHDQ